MVSKRIKFKSWQVGSRKKVDFLSCFLVKLQICASCMWTVYFVYL